MREAVRRDGYVVVPRLLDPSEVEAWTARLESLSGLSRADHARPGFLGARRRGLVGAWTLPDGVTRTPDFWPLTVHAGVRRAVGEALGPDARFLQHTDLHVGFSALGWHRDSVDRRLGVGPDWDETAEPYAIVRVGVYLQSAASRFRLGVAPGSHRARSRFESRGVAWLSALRNALGRASGSADGAEWLELGSGDAVLFDPRLLHSGSPIDGPKYSFFLCYGVPNRHFHRHRAYYRHHRPELGYGDPAPELLALLRQAGLHAPDAERDPTPPGFRPGALQTLLARRVRSLGPRRT